MATEKKVETVCRFVEAIGKQYKDGGVLREGERLMVYENQFGVRRLNVITRWHLGYLWGIDGNPAVECDDCHTEFWTKGQLDNRDKDPRGRVLPAIQSMYNGREEYWENGIQKAVGTFTPLIPEVD